ncbi:MAG: xanthine phosphoribosyltransferase [Clostridia bacterium]|nr:xanthine phosphoribosyltransferase [Clostridia bacterium]
MKELEQKILTDGAVYPGNILKVSNFLNHQLDADFLMKIGEEIARLFANDNITKIVTIEASGIAIAIAAAAHMHIPAVFAKKNQSTNIAGDVYTSMIYSYTHQNQYVAVIAKEFLSADDRVLIVDDFLARGNALRGLIDIVGQSGATVAGISTAIEKGFQGGGDALRAEGYRVESLAIVDSMTDDSVTFRAQ